MRIVAGRFKGRALAAPSSNRVRPTTDRLRESVFNVLAHAYDNPVEGARVLDLFAGTGALGLEALSRGAAYAQFIDDSTEGRGLIRENIEALGVAGITKIFRRDATRLGDAHPNQPFDLVFCDPPYGKGLAEQALASARSGGWLKPKTLLVIEEESSAEIALPDGFTELERREYGTTQFIFARAV